MVICVPAINELMWHIFCVANKLQFIQDKWHKDICFAVHCCHGVRPTSTPNNVNPHQMRILQTSLNQ
jgi:hypothetical protein